MSKRNFYFNTEGVCSTLDKCSGHLAIPPSLPPQSHQTFRPVLAVKLLGITLRNRCWPTTFQTITTEDADRRMVLELTGVINPSCMHHIWLLEAGWP